MDAKLITRNISFWVSTVLIFVTGLFFILFTDLYLSSGSVPLFIGIIFAFGSGVLTIVAEGSRSSKTKFIIFKIISIVCAICFVVFLIYVINHLEDLYGNALLKCAYKTFKTKDDGIVLIFDQVNFRKGVDVKFDPTGTFVVTIVASIVAAVVEAVNIIINFIVGIEE